MDSVATDHAGRGGGLEYTFWIDEDEKLLFLSYGSWPAVLSIYNLDSFQHIHSTVVNNYVTNIYLDEDNVYTGKLVSIFGRDVVYKINLKTGSKMSLESIPLNVVEATECKGEITLQRSELLLKHPLELENFSEQYDDILRVYKKADNLVCEIEKDSVTTAHAGRGGSLDPNFWIDEDEKLLFLEYGYKPTVLSIYNLNSFEHLHTTVVSPWLYQIYLDEDNVYTRGGKNAFGRYIYYKINLVSGLKTSLDDIPPNVIEATEYSWDYTLQFSDFLLEASEDDDVFRIYSKEN